MLKQPFTDMKITMNKSLIEHKLEKSRLPTHYLLPTFILLFTTLQKFNLLLLTLSPRGILNPGFHFLLLLQLFSSMTLYI